MPLSSPLSRDTSCPACWRSKKDWSRDSRCANMRRRSSATTLTLTPVAMRAAATATPAPKTARSAIPPAIR